MHELILDIDALVVEKNAMVQITVPYEDSRILEVKGENVSKSELITVVSKLVQK